MIVYVSDPKNSTRELLQLTNNFAKWLDIKLTQINQFLVSRYCQTCSGVQSTPRLRSAYVNLETTELSTANLSSCAKMKHHRVHEGPEMAQDAWGSLSGLLSAA